MVESRVTEVWRRRLPPRSPFTATAFPVVAWFLGRRTWRTRTALVFNWRCRRETRRRLRARVCRSAGWLGIAPDEAANLAGAARLTLADSPVRAWVVATDEQGIIAAQAARTLES